MAEELEKLKELRIRVHDLAKRIATELHGRKGVIDEVNSELYTITNELFFMYLKEKLSRLDYDG